MFFFYFLLTTAAVHAGLFLIFTFFLPHFITQLLLSQFRNIAAYEIIGLC